MTSLKQQQQGLIIEPGVKVWVAHPTSLWQKAEIVRTIDDKQVQVITEEEREELNVDVDAILMQNPSLLEGVDDMTSLSYLHEAAVLENIRFRLALNQIYTYTGSLLIAINPYARLPLYSREMIEAFCGQPSSQLPPHVYAIAEQAYREMLNQGNNQSILVSGESGAGKTETTKFLLSYFAAMAEKSKAKSEGAHEASEPLDANQSIEERVLKSTPVLEAFGNAKTLRNDNSSRFGKFIEIQFDKLKGTILGARIRHYLLEKSRIVRPPTGERNYHVFYQLLAGASTQEREDLQLLGGPEMYRYLMQSGVFAVEDVDETNMFEITCNALRIVGLGETELDCVWRVISAILHVGNVSFEQEKSGEEASAKVVEVVEASSEGAPYPAGYNPLATAATLMGVNLAALQRTLTVRKITAGRESYELNMTVQQAQEARDSFSMLLYSRLFDWLVMRINESIYLGATNTAKIATISVLDIYGFEFFETNSFEQFTINYANEVLQNQFNQHIFKLEQQEYVKEKIDWSYVEFNDNQACVELIESKPLGILALLDEECTFPKATPATLASKLYANHGKNKFFEKPRFSQTHFGVKHYAGDVMYDTTLFLEKNKDYVVPDQVAVMEQSTAPFVKGLVTAANAAGGDNKAKSSSFKFISVASQFRESLAALMASIKSTTPHYIRCVKPNAKKLALSFDAKMVLHQMKCGGVMEQLRISRAGYPGRMPYANFFRRYKLLAASEVAEVFGKRVPMSPNPRGTAPPSPGSAKNARRGCEILINKLNIEKDKVQFGETKIFLRAGVVANLEQKRSSMLNTAATQLQKNWKAHTAVQRYSRIKRAAQTLQNSVRTGAARSALQGLREEAAATKIQTYMRRTAEIMRYRAMQVAASTLQRCVRGVQARWHLQELREDHAATCLQAQVRAAIERGRFTRYRHALVRLQTRWRGICARRELRELRTESRKLTNVVAEKNKLEEKVQNLQFKISAESRVRAKLEDELKRAHQDLTEARSQLEKVTLERNSLAKEQTNMSSAAAQALKSQLAKDETALANQKEQDEAAKNKMDEATRKGQDELKAVQAAADAEKADLAKQVAQLQAELAAMKEAAAAHAISPPAAPRSASPASPVTPSTPNKPSAPASPRVYTPSRRDSTANLAARNVDALSPVHSPRLIPSIPASPIPLRPRAPSSPAPSRLALESLASRVGSPSMRTPSPLAPATPPPAPLHETVPTAPTTTTTTAEPAITSPVTTVPHVPAPIPTPTPTVPAISPTPTITTTVPTTTAPAPAPQTPPPKPASSPVPVTPVTPEAVRARSKVLNEENQKLRKQLALEQASVTGFMETMNASQGTIKKQEEIIATLRTRLKQYEGKGEPSPVLAPVKPVEVEVQDLPELIMTSSDPLDTCKLVLDMLVETYQPNRLTEAESFEKLFVSGIPEPAFVIYRYLMVGDRHLFSKDNSTKSPLAVTGQAGNLDDFSFIVDGADPQFLNYIVESLDGVIQANTVDNNVLCFWLANVSLLLNLTYQTGDSGEEDEVDHAKEMIDFSSEQKLVLSSSSYNHSPIVSTFARGSSPRVSPALPLPRAGSSSSSSSSAGAAQDEEGDGASASQNTPALRTVLKKLFVKIYLTMLWNVSTKLNRLLHVALFDMNTAESMEPVTALLDDMLAIFQRNLVYIPIACHFFEQVFYYMNAVMFNEVLLRKDLNSLLRGLNMKMKLAEVDSWVRDHGKEWAGQASDHLQHIRQCILVMIVNKKLLETKENREEICPHLSMAQIKQLLTMYCIDEDSFEPQIHMSIINSIMKSPDYRADAPLLLDTSKIAPLYLEAGVHYIQPVDIFHIKYSSKKMANDAIRRDRNKTKLLAPPERKVAPQPKKKSWFG
eukprot:TRINITY_DN57_c0_g2_i1.p1 TRINITY_DN57_c0_g2~~TRINITY_DN57_c0_g2_i1.p1  ORF type:complete len:1863 (-),score=713.26 TRINITY_DN57_c0_g2_i1:63-5651(-)